jgi:asparagine synthase (glutamine-hydrolysing)
VVSGIAGIYFLDGRPVRREQLEKMNQVQRHRGPDRGAVWYDGAVGLGHRMLQTTVESLHEVLPLVEGTADLAITADARIDNREELISQLDFKKQSSAEIADSELILAAYSKWGEHCPEYLLGDFAFVVWDGRQRMLFCARDHFGVKPFYYYYLPRHFFVFASEIKGLLCSSEVPRQLNELQIGDYLSGLFEDKGTTFYQNILRLPPAHWLTIAARGASLHSYWSLDPSRELQLNSADDYAAAFCESFTEAVRCRLRSAFPIGSHLSGGLDSSAVTCTARQVWDENDGTQWHVFSNIFDDVPECDERPFINAVLAQGGYIPHYIHADGSSPLMDLERVFWHQDEPFIGPNHFLPWQLNRAVSEAGVRVVLDGFDGDTTVSHGAARFTELAYAGKWQMFAHEANGVSRHFNVTPHRLLETYGVVVLEELAKKQRWLAFATAINQINRSLQASRSELLWRHGLKPILQFQMIGKRTSSQTSIEPIINAEFACQIGLKERLRDLKRDRLTPPRTAREEQWQKLTSGFFTTVLELSDRSAAAFSIEGRHPFMDKRLIELCLAMPPEQKLHNGWSRSVMRHGLSGILPEEIRWRGGKTDMNPNFVCGLLISDRDALDEAILNQPQVIEKYVNIGSLSRLYRRLVSRDRINIEDAMTIWKVATLVCWLRSGQFRNSG